MEEEGGFTLSDFMAIAKEDTSNVSSAPKQAAKKKPNNNNNNNNKKLMQQLFQSKKLQFQMNQFAELLTIDESQESYIVRAFEKCHNKRERKEMLKAILAHLRTLETADEVDWETFALPVLTRERINQNLQVESTPPETTAGQRTAINALVKKVKLAMFSGNFETEDTQNDDKDQEEEKQQIHTIKCEMEVEEEEEEEDQDQEAEVEEEVPKDDQLGQQATTTTPKAATKKGKKKNKQKEFDEDDIDVERMKVQVIGLSETLEKEYLRLTRYPKAEDIRSEATLRKSFDLMKAKALRGEANYEYFQSQYRSIRQDLHVQNIRNAFTIEVFEHNARVCLENSDSQEYGRCLGQLVWMYKESILNRINLNENGDPSPAYREFVFYRLIESIFSNKKDELLLCLQEINVDSMLVSEELERAMKFEHALQIGNVRGFFVLYSQTVDHSKYIMNRHIQKWYIWGLKILCKAYGPLTMNVEIVQQTFVLPSIEEALRIAQEAKCVFDETKTKILVKDTMQILHSMQ